MTDKTDKDIDIKRLSINLLGIVSVCTAVIYGTWVTAQGVRDFKQALDDNTAAVVKLNGLIEKQWTEDDMIRFAETLQELNPSVKVPKVWRAR